MAPSALEPRTAPPKRGNGHAARVLVVDDEPGIRNLVVDILGDEGYETRAAEDGVCAIEVLRGWTPDLILLDLSMPRMDGWQFLEARRELGIAPHARVIVVSASRHIDERVAARHRVLPKPFEVEHFLDALREVLGSHDSCDGDAR
ncbi:MAG: response regulator [Dehalococcoidia bacterium]